MPVIDAVVTGEIESHVAISDEFAIVLSGQLTATIDGVERVSRAGDYLVVPAGAQHGIVPDGECRLLLIGRI
ncbi:Cupin domain protein [compost metagenome]